jgi:single-strand DNA-binding protein
MASFNKVFLMGNLTRDPEIRTLPSGSHLAEMTVAVNHKFKLADGTEREETCFARVTVFGRQAETCGQYLRKGRPVFVEGRLKTEEWEKDGKTVSRLAIIAERVQFLGAPLRGGEVGDAPDAHGDSDNRAPRGGYAPRDEHRPSSPTPPPAPTAGRGDFSGSDDLADDNPPF